jgi:PHP family Zn ribbon phosphoesterase
MKLNETICEICKKKQKCFEAINYKWYCKECADNMIKRYLNDKNKYEFRK